MRFCKESWHTPLSSLQEALASWQSIILQKLNQAMESFQRSALLWIASSFTAFIPRNDRIPLRHCENCNAIRGNL
ncbi:hypothetical protein [Helicobacter rodentium]|uniref:hypothetical protein n=1 Tax=Helicobacter rodentium TaxID=59617 RepID=UPI00146FB9FC|nr:hypothetical protein [Helicobacter rodentium]